MKTRKPTPENLSPNQLIIWDCITLSEHPLNTISKRSGYSEQGIKNWMFGVFEPPQLTVDNIVDTMEMLKFENPSSVNWKIKKSELISLKSEQKTAREMAEIIGTTIPSIEHAVARFCNHATHPTT